MGAPTAATTRELMMMMMNLFQFQGFVSDPRVSEHRPKWINKYPPVISVSIDTQSNKNFSIRF